FFFQAEDGIRDFHVTGVQTCALPICAWSARPERLPRGRPMPPGPRTAEASLSGFRSRTCSKRTALPDTASAERSGLSFSLVPYLLNTTMICCRKTHGRLVRFPFYLPCARKKYALAGEAHGRLFPPRSAQAAAV